MQNPTPNEIYETRDLWLAAALMATGRRLAGLSWHDGRAYFTFQDAASCQTSADGYWRRELVVAAKDFADALRTLKDRLHGGDARSHRGSGR